MWQCHGHALSVGQSKRGPLRLAGIVQVEPWSTLTSGGGWIIIASKPKQEHYMCLSQVYLKTTSLLKVKLSPKSRRGFIWDWIWVKPLCKSIITIRDTFKIYHSFVFGQANFQFSMRFQIVIFRTLRRLNATWNFARSITRVSTHEHSIENIVCVRRVYWKGRFWTTHFSSSTSSVPPSWQTKSVDPRVQHYLTGSRSIITLLPVRSHSGINTFWTSWCMPEIQLLWWVVQKPSF